MPLRGTRQLSRKCGYCRFKSRQRLEAEILVQCLKRPLLVSISTVSFFSPFAAYCRSYGDCVTANCVDLKVALTQYTIYSCTLAKWQRSRKTTSQR
jgi:hypothetical protein